MHRFEDLAIIAPHIAATGANGSKNLQGQSPILAILIPVKDATPRIVRVNITMPEDVLARIDAHAESKGMNRSGFLAFAAKRQMEEA